MCRANQTKTFNPVVYLAKHACAPFSARKDLESGLHHCSGLVEVVRASFSSRKDLESSFNKCGGTVKLLRASFSARKDLE